jgi:hypothetical protein
MTTMGDLFGTDSAGRDLLGSYSGAEEPVFAKKPSQTTQDGNLIWVNCGSCNSPVNPLRHFCRIKMKQMRELIRKVIMKEQL